MTPFVYSIGDVVEVFCDHKRSGRRIRDWVEGVVVHADERMTAVQFRNDVYLTDGWMVPDRILWFNKGSVKIRIIKKPRRHSAIKLPKLTLSTKKKRKSVLPKKRKNPTSRKNKPARKKKHR